MNTAANPMTNQRCVWAWLLLGTSEAGICWAALLAAEGIGSGGGEIAAATLPLRADLFEADLSDDGAAASSAAGLIGLNPYLASGAATPPAFRRRAGIEDCDRSRALG